MAIKELLTLEGDEQVKKQFADVVKSTEDWMKRLRKWPVPAPNGVIASTAK
jgi:hypothetical protein